MPHRLAPNPSASSKRSATASPCARFIALARSAATPSETVSASTDRVARRLRQREESPQRHVPERRRLRRAEPVAERRGMEPRLAGRIERDDHAVVAEHLDRRVGVADQAHGRGLAGAALAKKNVAMAALHDSRAMHEEAPAREQPAPSLP